MAVQRTLHQSLDFSQIAQVWRGAWDEGTIYRLNDTVRVNGKAYVCSTTNLIDNNLFGQEYKPGVDTTDWTLVVSGSVYKGDWSYKDRHYAGDIVRWNSDFYQCVTDNYGGHPIYENGGLSTKWTLIGTARTDKIKNALWPMNWPPMGWTRNQFETPEQYGSHATTNLEVINGNYTYATILRDYGRNGGGMGERSTTWTQNSQASGVFYRALFAGFDFWDYMDGYNTTFTGQAPRLIQIVGTGEYTLYLFDSGELYSTGYGGTGEIGDGTTTTYKMVRRVGRSGARGTGVLLGVRIIKVTHSNKSGIENQNNTHTSAALDNLGRVWTWGYNAYGSCGDGTATNNTTPYLIPQAYFHNKQIVDVWMQGYDNQSCFAQTIDGELYAWGYNGDGRLGLDTMRQYVFRPERVKYNWNKYGGIAKFSCVGNGGACITIVQTNDGSIHGCGYLGQGSLPVYGAGITQDSYVPAFTPLAQVLNVRANSLGLGRKTRDIGALIDVTRNVDEFWLMAGGGPSDATLFIKEKGTGAMYAMGWNYGSVPVFTRSAVAAEYAANNPHVVPNMAFPTLIDMGNMTDIKYIAKSGTDTSLSLMFQNRDGRLWSNGYGTNYNSRGIGQAAADPYGDLRRLMKLPWETYWTSYTPTQARIAEPANLLMGWSQASGQSGFAIITSNSRLISIGGQMDYYYGRDPGQTANNGASNDTCFNRLEY